MDSSCFPGVVFSIDVVGYNMMICCATDYLPCPLSTDRSQSPEGMVKYVTLLPVGSDRSYPRHSNNTSLLNDRGHCRVLE